MQRIRSSEPTDKDWLVPVLAWSVFEKDHAPDSAGTTVPDVSFVEPMLRRRLSEPGKMGLHVANICMTGSRPARFVYASRHGELRRTMALLETLANREALSPTAFSLSVLNATAGLWSILRKDRSPATAVSAGEETFGFGLLEAAMQAALHPEEQVLFVYADEPVPSCYDTFVPNDAPAHAVAVLLGSGPQVTLGCRITCCASEAGDHSPQSFAFLRCLAGDGITRWTSDTRNWQWLRHAA